MILLILKLIYVIILSFWGREMDEELAVFICLS